MTGYLKLYRQFLAWEWYSDLPVRVLFLHCLLKANYNPAKWKGKTIKTGQFVTSLAHLAQETGLTLQQTRTALSKLKSTCELTQHSTSQYSIITVNNWGKWQCEQHAEQQASNKRATTIKERKKNKNSNTVTTNEIAPKTRPVFPNALSPFFRATIPKITAKTPVITDIII